LSLLLVVAVVLRALRSSGIWGPTLEAGIDPRELWRALGFGAKLSVIVAFIVIQGPMYFALFEASAWQATIGKRLLDIYVTDENGQRISVARSCGRSSVKWIVGCFGGSFMSAITIAFREKREALHDYTADTKVMRGRPPQRGTLEVWRVAAAFVLPFGWTLGTFLVTP